MDYLFLLALALSPGLAIILFIFFQDKYEHEPIKLLAMSFLYGVISLVVAFYLSKLINYFFILDENNLTQQAFHAFAVVAFIEESIKFLFVRGILYYDKNFDEPFDGIVYSVMVGMGFATAENIVYVYNGGIDVAVVRMFSAVPAHATFAIVMGYFLGKAKFMNIDLSHLEGQNVNMARVRSFLRKKSMYLGFLGLFMAILLHGFYDYFLFISFAPGVWIGSIIALVVGIYFSREVISKQQEISPFKTKKNENDK